MVGWGRGYFITDLTEWLVHFEIRFE